MLGQLRIARGHLLQHRLQKRGVLRDEFTHLLDLGAVTKRVDVETALRQTRTASGCGAAGVLLLLRELEEVLGARRRCCGLLGRLGRCCLGSGRRRGTCRRCATASACTGSSICLCLKMSGDAL